MKSFEFKRNFDAYCSSTIFQFHHIYSTCNFIIIYNIYFLLWFFTCKSTGIWGFHLETRRWRWSLGLFCGFWGFCGFIPSAGVIVCHIYICVHNHMCTHMYINVYMCTYVCQGYRPSHIHMSVWVIPCHMHVFSSTESSWPASSLSPKLFVKYLS